MKKLTVKNLPPKLVAFLKENNALEEYLYEINTKTQTDWRMNNNRTKDGITDSQDIISYTLHFVETRKYTPSNDYWAMLNNKYNNKFIVASVAGWGLFKAGHGKFELGCQRFTTKDLALVISLIKSSCSNQVEISEGRKVTYEGCGVYRLGTNHKFSVVDINRILKQLKLKTI